MPENTQALLSDQPPGGPAEPEGLSAWELDKVRRLNEEQGKLTGYNCPICRNKGRIYVSMDTVRECECMAIRRGLSRASKSSLSREMLSRYTFARYGDQAEWQKKTKAKAMAYAKSPAGWFYIGGQPGAGKTHLCVAIMNRLLKAGWEGLYMEWRSTAQTLKAVMNTPEHIQLMGQYHDPEKGSFLTALQYFVKHQIQAATIGGHGRYMTTEEGKTVRIPADPLSSASSLDEQLPSDDDDRTIADMVADPAAVQEFESLEKSLYLETLRPVLDKALAMLPEQQREVIRGRFFEKLTLKQAGECVGVSASRAAQLENYGLRAMRRNASLRRFYGEDLLSRAYRGTGFGAWAHRGSVEERLVEKQEERERREAAYSTKHLAELLNLDVAELCGLLE